MYLTVPPVMPRFRFRRRRSFGRMVRRARPIVKAAAGITLAKRVLLDSINIADVTSTNYDNPTTFDLLACVASQAEGVESTGGSTAGTDVATAPIYSRITALRLNFYVKSGASTDIRYMVFKSPDNDITGAQAMAAFHSSDDTQAVRELRKCTIAKGFFGISSDRLQNKVPIFVKRQALARIAPLREDDRLKFVIAKHADGTTATLNGFGTIYVKANG